MASELEGVRIQILRNEIAQRNLDLHRLETIAKEIPLLESSSVPSVPSHSVSPEFSPKSTSSSRSSYSQSPVFHFSPDPNSRQSQFMQSDQKIADTNHATTSSKVIEALQNSLDSLRRDLNFQTERAIEERRNREAIQHKYDSLSEQYNVLRLQNGMFNSILSRKDRKIEDLEKKYKHEMALRKENQQSTEILTIKVDELERYNAKEHERRVKAETSYDTLTVSSMQSLKQLRDKLGLLRSEIDRAWESRREDMAKIKLLEKNLEDATKERIQIIKIQDQLNKCRDESLSNVRSAIQELRHCLETRQEDEEALIKSANEALKHLK